MTTFTPEELRAVGAAAVIWLRMLEAREGRIVASIHSGFRNGEREFLAQAAELSTIREQIHEIKSAMRQNDAQKG